MSERPEGFEPDIAAERAQFGQASGESGVTDEVTPDGAPGMTASDAERMEDGRMDTGPSDPGQTEADRRGAQRMDSEGGAQLSGAEVDDAAVVDAKADGAGQGENSESALAQERLEDLQRLQAEYVNYKRRVDRDRAGVQERAIADVIDTLLPVLDDIHAAREHGDLTDGPFAAIAEKLEASLGKFGLERFGAAGEAFDPTVHEALLHTQWDDAVTPADPAATTVVQVLQPGYRTGQRVIRPARVSVADPQ